MEENFEIDVMKLLLTLKKRLPLVIAAAILGALIMFIATRFFSVPMYRSEALIYISNKVAYDTNIQSVNIVDVNTSIQLVPVFSQLLNTNAVLDKVAAASNLPYSAGQISRIIRTEQVADTAVLKVIASGTDPQDIAVLANTVATTGILEITKVAPGSSAYLIDEAEAPLAPYAPSMPKRLVIGFFFGAVIAAALIVLRELLDTKVHSEDDLAQIIGAPVLGVVGRQNLQSAK
ncbi:MAG: hypothetical protein J1F63_04630 [Oscillospiraceae bacterium]|nr:hypothetical protein [Oscillospiraceae bacterium]